MQELLNQLRALGVHIPPHLGNPEVRVPPAQAEAELLRQAKLLNPWSVATGPGADGYYATTKRKQLSPVDDASTSYAATEVEAALKLLLKQLKASAYNAQTTEYKMSSMAFRANQ
jgi:hypothetical protein